MSGVLLYGRKLESSFLIVSTQTYRWTLVLSENVIYTNKTIWQHAVVIGSSTSLGSVSCHEISFQFYIFPIRFSYNMVWRWTEHSTYNTLSVENDFDRIWSEDWRILAQNRISSEWIRNICVVSNSLIHRYI